MDIFKAYELLQGIIFPRENILELTRLEQMVEGDNSGIIPKYLLEQEYIDNVEEEYESLKLLGIKIGNPSFIHSLMLWGKDKVIYEVPSEISSFVLETDPNNQLESNLFHEMPKQSFYINQPFDQYSGLLVCYDYYHSVADEKIATLEVFLLDQNNKNGHSIQLILPEKNRVIDWSEHKKTAYWQHAKQAINLLIFVLTELEDSEVQQYPNREIYTVGRKYIEDVVEQDMPSTFYRKAHWHKYWIKNDEGKRESVLRWIKPTLVKKSS